jgi:parallel beta-helix repeat protein
VTQLVRNPSHERFDGSLNYAVGTIGAVIGDPVNVRAFPWLAKGDGVTDDTAAIQAALNTGRRIFVPGTDDYYKISAALAPLDYQRIYGEGGRSQIRQVTALANVITATGKTGVVVENIKAYATGDFSGYATGAGIAFVSSSHCKAIHCEVENHRGAGVLIYNSNDCTADKNTFLNSPVLVSDLDGQMFADVAVVYSSSRNKVTGNFCLSGQGTGVLVQSVSDGDIADDNIVTGNSILNTLVYGICAYRNSQALPILQSVQRTIIVGNNINGVSGAVLNSTTGTYTYGAGIYLQGAESSVVKENPIRNTHSGGVTFAELLSPGAIGATNLTRATISHNPIDACGMFGIDVGDPNNFGEALGVAVVDHNTITSCAKSGINVRNRGRISLDTNTVDTTGLSGIRVNNTGTIRPGITLKGNTARNTTGTAGIEINFADALAADNTVDTSTTHGIYAANSTVEVLGGKVLNHAVRGVHIASTCPRAKVDSVTVAGTGSSSEGMRFDAATRYANNSISGCASPYAGTFSPFHTLTVNSATPSVSEAREVITNNTAPTTIGNFTGGYDGQEILVVFTDANTTLDFTGSNLKGNGGVDRVMSSGDAVRAVFRAGGVNAWYVTVLAAA